MRKSLRLFLLLLLAMMPAALFAQEDFSADIVTHHQGEQDKTPAKIYVTKNKLRIESAGRNGQTAARQATERWTCRVACQTCSLTDRRSPLVPFRVGFSAVDPSDASVIPFPED
jgi:hypothetical protein